MSIQNTRVGERKPSVSGRSAESAAFISGLYRGETQLGSDGFMAGFMAGLVTRSGKKMQSVLPRADGRGPARRRRPRRGCGGRHARAACTWCMRLRMRAMRRGACGSLWMVTNGRAGGGGKELRTATVMPQSPPPLLLVLLPVYLGQISGSSLGHHNVILRSGCTNHRFYPWCM
jgi:hypothetical protein